MGKDGVEELKNSLLINYYLKENISMEKNGMENFMILMEIFYLKQRMEKAKEKNIIIQVMKYLKENI